MLNDLEIQRVIREVASRSGTTPGQVRHNIEQLLEESRACRDPKVRAAWAAIPCKGETPTMEEVMNYLAERLKM